MAQTKITSKSLATNTIAAANIADNAIESRHLTPTLFSPNIYSDKINSSTGYMGLPAGTTAQRPASPANGSVRFNTDFGFFEWYDSLSGLWLQMNEKRPASATGGTVATIVDPADGFTYRTHTYTTLGGSSFVVTRSGVVEFLVVAGGGSGGNRNTTNANGGGGGGGVLYKKDHYVNVGTIPVYVGDGGLGLAFQVSSGGNNGQNSFFGSFIALGGGGGGATDVGYGRDGGSGGGTAWDENLAGRSIQTAMSGAQAFGNDGGVIAGGYTGAGGGGAGTAGNTWGQGGGDPYTQGGNVDDPPASGGRGAPFTISGTLRYYAGGGGGGANSSEKAGMGWHGGGRGFGTTRFYTYLNYPVEINASTLGSGTPDAIDGTGGGGGAGSYWSNNSTNWINRGSGNGGSGIVIVRYRI
jgi:hypothetical protein